MSIKEFTLVTVKQRYMCDVSNCNGEMFHTGHSQRTSQGVFVYKHMCNVCGVYSEFETPYPIIVNKEIEIGS